MGLEVVYRLSLEVAPRVACDHGVHCVWVQVPVPVADDVEAGADKDDVRLGGVTRWPDVQVERDRVGDGLGTDVGPARASA